MFNSIDLDLLIIPSSQFDQIKQKFGSAINSNRQIRNCKTAKDVYTLLDKRDEWNMENMQHFQEIFGLTQFSPVSVPSSYSSSISDFENCNISVKEEKIHAIYNMICDNIGASYKDFARELKMTEGDIDELDQEKSIKERVRKILVFHEQQTNEHIWRCDLLKALKEINRNDLREKVELRLDYHKIVRPLNSLY